MYKYDTHIHTADVSTCATALGKYQAVAYKEAGYSGIFITNHFFRSPTCAVPKNLPWAERVDLFCHGYEEAKSVGDKIGLQVFFGWEETYLDQDFLVYGLDKNWLLEHPEVERWTLEQQYEEISKYGGMVIHAHPFRDRPYISKIRLYPNLVHGVEAFNGANYEEENRQAYLYAKKYNLPITAGSDSHHTNIVCSGIETDKPLHSVHDYIRLVLEKKPYQMIISE